MTLTTDPGTDRAPSTTPSSTTLRDRARELAPVIRERAAEVETQRFVHAETVDAMVEAGFFRAFQPSRFGGLEAPPEDFFGSIVELGKACPSTSWILGILGIHAWEFAQMGLEVQEEVWGDDPTTLVSSSYAAQGKATPVPGGYRLKGEWRSSSGIVHSTWSVVGAIVPRQVEGHDEPVPNAMSFLLPHDDPSVTIIDDWYTMGLAGTGSRRIVLDDVFVPEHRSIDRDVLIAKAGPGLAVNTSPLYQLPYGAMYIGPGSAPAIGAGWGFYQEFLAKAAQTVRRTDGVRLSEDRLIMWRLAEAHARLSDMEIVMLHRYRELYAKVCAGQTLSPEEQALAAFDLSRCGGAAVDAVTSLMPSLGAGVVYSGNTLQRFYRDVLTMRQHGTQDPDNNFAKVIAAQFGRNDYVGFHLALTPEAEEAARQRATGGGNAAG